MNLSESGSSLKPPRPCASTLKIHIRRLNVDQNSTFHYLLLQIVKFIVETYVYVMINLDQNIFPLSLSLDRSMYHCCNIVFISFSFISSPVFSHSAHFISCF